jgi:phosphoribosylaminoimidazolecarboxamide formyltransferase / IMP cyclohydrolase
MKNFQAAYRTMEEEHFPPAMEISFVEADGSRQTLTYEKETWDIAGERKGLRYGDNPGQEAALYRLSGGNLRLGEVESIAPGRWLLSDTELLQSGKHPGKTNLTDVDSALNIIRYFPGTPVCAIIKHNNPSGVALGTTPAEAYAKAFAADPVAAFGGAVVLNRPVDVGTAELVAKEYVEVLAAPEYEPGAMDILAKKKNLRILRIGNIAKLESFIGSRVLDFRSLVDGGFVAQWSFAPEVFSPAAFLKAEVEREGKRYAVDREPTEREAKDLVFAWLVECGVTSNSVLYAKDGCTVGIGAGQQDRVGVAELARDRAYRNAAERIARERFGATLFSLDDENKKREILAEVEAIHGGLKGSVMASDAYFPFRDGIDVGLGEGVTAVIQPGGSLRDFESIEACNERGAAMVFTGQRCFRH